jgi:transposase-like protein
MTTDRIEVITSVERRRRWSTAEKTGLVAAMNEQDAVVTEIARSAGIHSAWAAVRLSAERSAFGPTRGGGYRRIRAFRSP